jgi:hypothetical protein
MPPPNSTVVSNKMEAVEMEEELETESLIRIND